MHWPERGRDLHLAQQRVHFGDREDAPGADRAVAGDGRGDMVELVAQAQRPAKLGDFRGEIGEQAGGVGLAERGGHGADQHRRRAEPLELEAHVGKVGAAPSSRSQSGSSSSTTSGISSAWRATVATVPRGAHPLEHQPLVRGMLVDDHQPVLGLGDDVGRGDLAAGDAERVARHGLDRRLGAGSGSVVEELRSLPPPSSFPRKRESCSLG